MLCFARVFDQAPCPEQEFTFAVLQNFLTLTRTSTGGVRWVTSGGKPPGFQNGLPISARKRQGGIFRHVVWLNSVGTSGVFVDLERRKNANVSAC